MGDFNPMRFDIAGAHNEMLAKRQADLDRLNDERDRTEARQMREFAIASEMAGPEKDIPAKVLRNNPAFNNVTGPQWDMIEASQKNRKRKESVAQQEKDAEAVGPDLSVLLSKSGDSEEARNLFQEQLAASGGANNASLLRRLGPQAETQKMMAAGQLPSQLGAERMDIRGEGRAFDEVSARNIEANLGVLFSDRDGITISKEDKQDAMDKAVYQLGHERAQEAIARAAIAGDAQRLDEARKHLGAQGVSSDRRRAELRNEYKKSGREKFEKENPVGYEELIISGDIFHDPPTEQNIMVDPGAGPKLKERRYSLSVLPTLLTDFEGVFDELGEEGFNNKWWAAGTQVEGTKLVQDIFRFTGQQSAAASKAITLGQAILIKVARMDQDARLSDFDLRLWVAAIPNLLDAGIGPDGKALPQLKGRFDGLRTILQMETNSILGGDAEAAAKEWARLEHAKLDKLPAGDRSELDRRVNAMREFQSDLAAFQAANPQPAGSPELGPTADMQQRLMGKLYDGSGIPLGGGSKKPASSASEREADKIFKQLEKRNSGRGIQR